MYDEVSESHCTGLIRLTKPQPNGAQRAFQIGTSPYHVMHHEKKNIEMYAVWEKVVHPGEGLSIQQNRLLSLRLVAWEIGTIGHFVHPIDETPRQSGWLIYKGVPARFRNEVCVWYWPKRSTPHTCDEQCSAPGAEEAQNGAGQPVQPLAP